MLVFLLSTDGRFSLVSSDDSVGLAFFYGGGLVFVYLRLRGGRAYGGIKEEACLGDEKLAIN